MTVKSLFKFTFVAFFFVLGLIALARQAPQKATNPDRMASLTIISVPQEYPTIQAAIDAAVDGDTVLVADSTYFENIRFNGKAITVASHFILDGDANHIANTIINGSQPANADSGSVVYFTANEDTNSVLTGFTITGGTGTLLAEGSRRGGGILSEYGAKITHNIITGNDVVGLRTSSDFASGGGISAGSIFTVGTPLTSVIKNNTVSNNRVYANIQAYGGGIFFHANGVISGNNVHDNVAKAVGPAGDVVGAFGGGLSCFWQATYITVEVFDNVIFGNQAIADMNGVFALGGGVDLIWTNANFHNNQVIGNSVSGAGFKIAGGVRFLLSSLTSAFTGNLIADNHSEGSDGGLLTVLTQDLPISNNRFIGNTCSTSGGGLSEFESVNSRIHNNLFLNNAAENGGGMALDNVSANPQAEQKLRYQALGLTLGTETYNDILQQTIDAIRKRRRQSGTKVTNNTFVGNHAERNGGGMYVEGTTTAMNNIVYGNTANVGSPQIHNLADTSLTVTWSDIEGGFEGTGNIDADPLFADTIDYFLTATSPAVDAGNPDAAYYDPENASAPGNACPPALGSITNDIGAYGGPGVVSDSTCPLTGIHDVADRPIISGYRLYQNYPNPFNPETVIALTMSKASVVTLTVFNMLGQEVATLVSGRLNAGAHQFVWQGGEQSSGVYFYRLVSGDGFSQTRKMILLR